MIIVLIFLMVIILLKIKSNFSDNNVHVALISCIYKPKNIETWLQIHRNFGISRFYINLENTPELVNYLKEQPDVSLSVSNSDNKNNYLSLQDRQVEFIQKALILAKKDNIDFVVHIDSDEILEGDINEILSLPPDVSTFWMQNYEAVYEKIPDKSDNCFQAKKYLDCSNEICASYINGKGGARVIPSIKVIGPHRFAGTEKEIKLNIIIKHYESCDFDQYIKKYKNLLKDVDLSKIPFVYYRKSIENSGNIDKLKEIYTKYRVI